MKKFDNNNLKFLLLVAAVLVVGIGIAYAALNTTLNITFNKVTQNAITWNVAFEGSTATGTPSGTSATGRVCGDASITASSVTIADSSVSKPGDKCTYELSIRNSGTVDAILNSITPTAPTSTSCSVATSGNLVCGNITYKLTTDAAGTTLFTSGGTLAAGTADTIYLVVAYNPTDEVQGTAIVQEGAKFTLAYTQA